MDWSRFRSSLNSQVVHPALAAMRSNYLPYHNYRHVMSMYKFLEDERVPYDESLDYAILFHDAIYDDQPAKELRSAELFQKAARDAGAKDIDVSRVQELIMATAGHKVTDISDLQRTAIIKADLHQLTSIGSTMRNFNALIDEGRQLYGIGAKSVAASMIQFLYPLWETIMVNAEICRRVEDIAFFNRAGQGMMLSIQMAKALVDTDTYLMDQ